MLQRNFDNSGPPAPAWWQELGQGAPTIAALARICADALVADAASHGPTPEELGEEAHWLLWLARSRGMFEVRAKRESFDSAERLLAICVEIEQDQWHWLLDKHAPEQSVRFLTGFGQLCRWGLVLHHLQQEFTLSQSGYELAKSLAPPDLPASITEFGNLESL